MPSTQPFILLTCALLSLTGCQHHSSHQQYTKPQSRSHITAPPSQSSRLADFYTSLINQENIVPDTAWYANLDSGERNEDYPTLHRSRLGDNRDRTLDFPLTAPAVSYREGRTKDYFQIRGQRIPEAFDGGDHAFPLRSIRRFRYQGGSYLVFNGRLQDFNGQGGRINFNYFFDFTHETILADMYDNLWELIEIPFLYGDLNSDHQLDRLRFDGIYMPALDHPDTITLVAETYHAKKWHPLTDGKMPYFIKLLKDERTDSLTLGACHWMRPVKL